jgi:glutathione synthase/RimK-type ligase-like ATP-grasp enzyme
VDQQSVKLAAPAAAHIGFIFVGIDIECTSSVIAVNRYETTPRGGNRPLSVKTQ